MPTPANRVLLSPYEVLHYGGANAKRYIAWRHLEADLAERAGVRILRDQRGTRLYLVSFDVPILPDAEVGALDVARENVVEIEPWSTGAPDADAAARMLARAAHGPPLAQADDYQRLLADVLRLTDRRAPAHRAPGPVLDVKAVERIQLDVTFFVELDLGQRSSEEMGKELAHVSPDFDMYSAARQIRRFAQRGRELLGVRTP